jgi:hypothetical protein
VIATAPETALSAAADATAVATAAARADAADRAKVDSHNGRLEADPPYGVEVLAGGPTTRCGSARPWDVAGIADDDAVREEDPDPATRAAAAALGNYFGELGLTPGSRRDTFPTR